MGESISSRRRSFLGSTLAAAAGVVAFDALRSSVAEASFATPSSDFRTQAFHLRVERAQLNLDATPTNINHPTNGDEGLYPNRIGSFTKGLLHQNNGEVDPAAWDSLWDAIQSGDQWSFESVLTGGTRKLTNPVAAYAFELEGADPRRFVMPAAPAFSSREEAAEIAENYWMALLRDVPFDHYDVDDLADAAAADLTRFGADGKWPKNSLGQVTPQLLFRGLTEGDQVGPYLSQFLYHPIAFGAHRLEQLITPYKSGQNYMTTFNEWLSIQRGIAPASGPVIDPLDPARYMISGRDIARWVHVDILFQAGLHGVLLLLGLGVPLNPGNPYNGALSKQEGFATLGGPNFQGLVGEVAQRALRAAWYQKWLVHRRLRPEVFAERVDRVLNWGFNYPVHQEILNSLASGARLGHYIPLGNALLPMAFPEGSPLHSAYPSGHATVAGATITLLKALFDTSVLFPNPKVPDPQDSTKLIDYTGPAITVEGELNKLASNIALGRNFAGVHWRSDATEGLRLGELIAIEYLKEVKFVIQEQTTFNLFQFRDFDGTTVFI
ncbi:vanadium-dependent haloperoxidase [Sorangium sp. So ce1128]